MEVLIIFLCLPHFALFFILEKPKEKVTFFFFRFFVRVCVCVCVCVCVLVSIPSHASNRLKTSCRRRRRRRDRELGRVRKSSQSQQLIVPSHASMHENLWTKSVSSLNSTYSQTCVQRPPYNSSRCSEVLLISE